MSGRKRKNSKRNVYRFCIIAFCAFAVIIGTKNVYAYYYRSSTINILAGSVGDFYTGDGDINMNIYIENNSNGYTKSDTIPNSGYTFNNAKTVCTSTCVQNDTSASCYYIYDSTNYTMSLTSSDKVTCSFYFDK